MEQNSEHKMYKIQRPIKIFSALALIATITIAAFLPFFSQLAKHISIISLCFGQVALIFLFILAAFPRANYRHIIELSTAYISFIGICFVLLSFLPFDSSNKIFGWENLPSLVLVDLPTLIFLNIGSFVYMNLGFYIYKESEDGSNPENISHTEDDSQNYQESFKDSLIKIYKQYTKSTTKSETPNQIPASKPIAQKLESPMVIPEKRNYGSMEKVKKELKSEVENLFSVYLNEEPASPVSPDKRKEQLNEIEEILIKNLDSSIEEALCMDSHGKILNNSVFRWRDANPEDLIDLFDRHNLSSEKLNTGRLCQVLAKSENHWYMIARYRNNFLALKSNEEDPGALLDTSFKVFKSL